MVLKPYVFIGFLSSARGRKRDPPTGSLREIRGLHGRARGKARRTREVSRSWWNKSVSTMWTRSWEESMPCQGPTRGSMSAWTLWKSGVWTIPTTVTAWTSLTTGMSRRRVWWRCFFNLTSLRNTLCKFSWKVRASRATGWSWPTGSSLQEMLSRWMTLVSKL